MPSPVISGTMLSSSFRWCDKTLSQQATWGGKGSFGLCFLCHNPSLSKVRAGSQSRNLETGLKQSLWQADTYRFVPPWQAQPLFDTTQSHLPTSGTSHSGLGPPKSSSIKKMSQTCLQAGLFGSVSQMTLTFPWGLQLASNWQKTNQDTCQKFFTMFQNNPCISYTLKIIKFYIPSYFLVMKQAVSNFWNINLCE